MNKKLLHFSAPWCGPCRAMTPLMNHIKEKYGDQIDIEKINVDDDKEMASMYKVNSIPAFILLENGQEVDRKRGMLTTSDMIKFLRL